MDTGEGKFDQANLNNLGKKYPKSKKVHDISPLGIKLRLLRQP